MNKVNVVGVVADMHSLIKAKTLGKLSRKNTGIDYIEIRVDFFKDNLDELEKWLKRIDIPKIITIRDKSEGGQADWSIEKRIELFKRFMPYATMFDIEIALHEQLKEIIDLATNDGIDIIGSHHQFDGQFDPKKIRSWRKVAYEQNMTIYKCAVDASRSQMLEMMVIYDESDEIPQSFMCMGEYGKLSRLIFAKFGSVLNYASINTNSEVVVGQWYVLTLPGIIEEL